MAEKYPVAADHSPIDPTELRVYAVGPPTEKREELPTATLVVEDVRAGVPVKDTEGNVRERSFEVELEYKVDGMTLDERTFEEYLRTYEAAKVSQETMTQLIRSHLREALLVEDVFVEVSNSTKKTRLGRPKA